MSGDFTTEMMNITNAVRLGEDGDGDLIEKKCRDISLPWPRRFTLVMFPDWTGIPTLYR